MSVESTRRTGALTERSLIDAVGDEQARGRVPALLVVGSKELEAAALQILKDDGPLGVLRGSSPAVRVDAKLPPDEWELRPRWMVPSRSGFANVLT